MYMYKNNSFRVSRLAVWALGAIFVCSSFSSRAQTIFSEDFQNIAINNQVGQFPSCWTTYGDDKTNVGNFTMFGSSWCVSTVETGNNAAASVSNVVDGGSVDRWMITPAITLSAITSNLYFRAFSADMEGTERLRVMVSTSGVEKDDFVTLRDLVFDGSQDVSGGWNNVELPLTDFAGQTIHIAFVNHGDGYFVFVDDIIVGTQSQNFHMPLLETFTSQHCGNCPEGEVELEGAYHGLEHRVAWLSHHAGFEPDIFTIDESVQLEALYGTSTYAPAVMIDRSMAFSEGNPGPVHYVGTAVMMHQTLSRAASIEDNIVIGFTDIQYSPENRQLQLTVEGRFVANQTIEEPRLTVYLAEDSLIAYQSSASNNYRHDHVVRACLTEAWGDEQVVNATTAGSTFTKTISYTLPADLRADKCYLVACVNSYGASPTQGRQVYNSIQSGYITNDHGGSLDIEDLPFVSHVVSAYPNPAVEMAYIRTDATILSASLLTMDGRVAMVLPSVNADLLQLDVQSLPSGLYIVRLVTDRGPVTTRLAVMNR